MRQAHNSQQAQRRNAPGRRTITVSGAGLWAHSTLPAAMETAPAPAGALPAAATRSGATPPSGAFRHGLTCLCSWLPLLLCLLLGACDSPGSHALPGGYQTLGGIVSDDPLAGATVVVYGPDGEILAATTTDEEGRYITALSAGRARRVVARGGTIAGAPFTGSMQGLCDGTPSCHVTPLTTLAAALVDDYGLSLTQARREVARTCGVNAVEDPFVLEHQGRADAADRACLAQLRARLEGGAGLATWLEEMRAIVPPPFDGPLGGTVDAAGRLAGARVQVIDNDGRLSDAVSDAEGRWQTPSNLVLNDDFRVESSGGSSFAGDFAGTLSACVACVDGRVATPVRLTILSTLVDRYMQASGRSLEDARAAVKTGLRIPADVGLDDDMIGMHFSEVQFLELCAQDGGFDAFADALVARIGSGETRSFGGAANDYEIVKVPFSGKVFNGILGGAGSAGVGFALNKLVTLLGPEVGYLTPEQITAERFAEIQNTLTAMNTRLDNLEGQLNTLTAALDIATNEIISHVYSASANSAAARIRTSCDEYATLGGPQDLPAFFDDMANNARELRNDLTEIDAQLFEPAIGTGSGMAYLTTSLEDKIKGAARGDEKNYVLYQAYKTLETIFTQAMAIQIKGAALLKTKYDYDDGGDLTRAETYLNGILRPRFVAQTEKFLIFVERLVAASADTRTMVTGGGAMFPSCTAAIFRDADLLAREFIEDHDAGFILHVAGDPKSIAAYCASPQGRDWGPPTWIPIKGDDLRAYDAPLPPNCSRYLGWTRDRNTRWHFSTETTIHFAKLKFAEVEDRLDAIGPQTVTYSFPYDQTARVDFERLAPADIPYAHCYVTARAIPHFDFKNEDILETMEQTYVPYEHKANMHGATLRARYGRDQWIRWHRLLRKRRAPIEVDTRANVYLEIINDSPAATDLRLSGAVAESVTNDTHGKTPATSQELHWKVTVGGERMFEHKYEYSVAALPWNHLRTSYSHTHTCDNGGTALWQAGGSLDVMRQVYFRVDRARSKMTCTDNLEYVDTVFKAHLDRLEIETAH